MFGSKKFTEATNVDVGYSSIDKQVFLLLKAEKREMAVYLEPAEVEDLKEMLDKALDELKQI